MPTKPRREDTFIERFLSAYEDHSWADADIDWVDRRIDGAVEAHATRKSDGKTLAIEHTIIQPFVGDKEDFAFFSAAFPSIEKDQSLLVPERWIQVFVPVGTLRHQPKDSAREAIVDGVHSWLKANRLSLRNGDSEHCCAIIGLPCNGVFDVKLFIKVIPLPGPGKLHVRRQQIENNLGDIVEKALRTKLPKLINTDAEKHILFLERQHMNLSPTSMLDEIDNRKSMFPDLAAVNEIWIVETMFYDTDSHLRFEHYENGTLVGSLDFLEREIFGEV
jgi:hypothetical protein